MKRNLKLRFAPKDEQALKEYKDKIWTICHDDCFIAYLHDMCNVMISEYDDMLYVTNFENIYTPSKASIVDFWEQYLEDVDNKSVNDVYNTEAVEDITEPPYKEGVYDSEEAKTKMHFKDYPTYYQLLEEVKHLKAKQITSNNNKIVYKKNDVADNKIRMDLIPLDILTEIGKVYTAGANKYGENKWQHLDNGYQRYKGALLRHLTASDKEDKDQETDCYHLAQVAWNAISMLWIKLNK